MTTMNERDIDLAELGVSELADEELQITGGDFWDWINQAYVDFKQGLVEGWNS